MNLVVGATGFLGSEICRRLIARGKPVRALVRRSADPAKIDNLKRSGAELVYGDLRNRASLDSACKGASAVITTATTTASRQPGDSIEVTDRDGQLSLIEAARAAGVRHFVYVSYSGGVDKGPDPCPLTVAKRTVERKLRNSGLAYTILRPSFFSEIWLSPPLGFDFPNARATLYGMGHNKISWISLGDVAEFAVQALDNPAARDAALELGGPQPLSPLEVLHVFEQVSGRPFAVTHVPVEALQAQKAAATDSLQQSFAALMLSYGAGDVIDMTETLKAFPVRLASVQDYARRVLVPA
jgi:NADH dehydrogenase